jgi:hypothetical protein
VLPGITAKEETSNAYFFVITRKDHQIIAKKQLEEKKILAHLRCSL